MNNKEIIEEFDKKFDCPDYETYCHFSKEDVHQFILSALEQKDIGCLENKEKLLNDYSNWLHKKGYIDTDYYSEEPKAVEEYLGIK